MRFKATLVGIDEVQHVLQALDKFEKTCLVKLSKSFTMFVVKGTASQSVEIFARLNSTIIFNDFRIESITNNEIYFEVNIKNLLQVLSNLSPKKVHIKQIYMRLSKKNKQPYLTCEIQSAQQASVKANQNITIVQDVPIQVLNSNEITPDLISEVAVGDVQVQLVLPSPLKELKTIVDRMKSLTKLVKDDRDLLIRASPNGKLELSIETTMSTVRTVFTNLSLPETEGNNVDQEENMFRNEPVEVKVDIQKISKFLHVHVTNPEEVVLAIAGRFLVLYCRLRTQGSYVTYYVDFKKDK
jgi:HUS1 checkpoint protein